MFLFLNKTEIWLAGIREMEIPVFIFRATRVQIINRLIQIWSTLKMLWDTSVFVCLLPSSGHNGQVQHNI